MYRTHRQLLYAGWLMAVAARNPLGWGTLFRAVVFHYGITAALTAMAGMAKDPRVCAGWRELARGRGIVSLMSIRPAHSLTAGERVARVRAEAQQQLPLRTYPVVPVPGLRSWLVFLVAEINNLPQQGFSEGLRTHLRLALVQGPGGEPQQSRTPHTQTNKHTLCRCTASAQTGPSLSGRTLCGGRG